MIKVLSNVFFYVLDCFDKIIITTKYKL